MYNSIAKQIFGKRVIMEKTQERGISYCIHSFMCEELGLSGGELLIFAIIYSFTKGELGLYYGTQEYLARSSGLCESSVRRILSSLLSKKYITECSYGERRGYKTTYPAEPLYCDGTEPCSSTEKIPAEPTDGEKAEFDVRDKSLYSVRPKYTYHCFGRYETVRLTKEQYKSLMTLVEPEIFQVYAHKLEALIMDKGYRTFSPYKTIKKWILEDGSA